jgi:adenylate kinase
VKVIDYGAIMMEILQRSGSPMERDDMSKERVDVHALFASLPVRVAVNSEGKPEEAAKQILTTLRGPEKWCS